MFEIIFMKNINLELYKKMYLVRMCEERIRAEYPKDHMKTPAHLCLGEEAIAAGVCQALTKNDVILGTYRNHGIYLSRTNDTDTFFTEMYGRQPGVAMGKAGSMHLSSPERGFIGTSAVVGTTIPLALGCAYALLYLKKKGVVVSFFGDGAVDEGVFWESLNFACLKSLPVIFVCEDNDLAIHAKVSERHGFNSLTAVVRQFDCHVMKSETTDAEIIFQMTKKAVKLVQKLKKPVFMHLRYYRYLEHVGINYDFEYGYRSENEYRKWLKKDPLKLQRAKLIRSGYSEDLISKVETNILSKIEKSVLLAEKASYPRICELYNNVYI